MNPRPLFVVALALAACGGNVRASAAQTPNPEPAAAAEASVQQFMAAVADSNLAKMAELWGTAKGPAARTKQPDNYERRIVIMQAYLRNMPFRIMSNAQDGSNADRRVLQVELNRRDCPRLVPFILIRSERGEWLVNSIDLALLGSPGSTCDDPAPRE
ncbi:MAG TPA: hypothetical protein VFU00_12420 [Gemmatimonadales bacterium]|nr:hypothetical protein [Gemmatimonadales bacterium]